MRRALSKARLEFHRAGGSRHRTLWSNAEEGVAAGNVCVWKDRCPLRKR